MINNKYMLENDEYEVIDVLSGITIEDAAVCRKHKIGAGNGERKIYLPGNIQEKYKFFDNFNSVINAIITKDNLLEYLKHSKKEFINPSQLYREDLKKEYKKLINDIEQLPDIMRFTVKKSEVSHAGVYINHGNEKKKDKYWNLIGDVALPRISRLSIIKLRRESNVVYLFKLSFGINTLIEDDIEEIQRSIERIENSKLSSTEKETIIKARVGQGTYRKKLLEESCICPFTLIDDEHLLVASHIKPWKDSQNKEKKDPKNGFLFSPTFDKLFDRGYISFNDDKTLIISPWLSEYNREKLGISEGMLIEKLPMIDDKRARYLEYHRKFVMKKMEDL